MKKKAVSCITDPGASEHVVVESRDSTRIEWVSGQGHKSIRRVWRSSECMATTLAHGRIETWSLEVTRNSPVTLAREVSVALLTEAQPKGWERMGSWKLGQHYKWH